MSQYESVYGIGLLDDIHNYFPELLYNQEAFDSPVLTYVRRQTRERFDLFSHGERQWRASLPVSSAAAAATAAATGAAAATASGFAAHRRAFSRTMATPVPSTPINSTLPTTTNSDILTTRLLLTLMSIPSGGPMGIGIGAGDNGFLQPVLVRPTAEEIEANTTVGHVVSDESVSCAICQDLLTPEQEGRKLLGCGHWFHRSCIDVWLTRNVRCPNCRHDVRVAVTSTAQ